MTKTIAAVFTLSAVQTLQAWGFLGHRIINETAVYTVPKPLFAFYKAHASYLKTHSTDPDMRRYVMEAEACRHYLDGDHYEKALPFDTLPHSFMKAVDLYGKDSILAHGIVPWHILSVLTQLTEAFSLKQTKRVLKLSADLGHYVGDCHVPLHSTSNYNGQKTGQNGVHALWESRLTELYSPDFDLFTGEAAYINDPQTAVWLVFEESHRLVDSVLMAERKAREEIPSEYLYVWEPRGARVVKVPSVRFAGRFQEICQDMVERRLRASILLLGSLWYTAWVNAGSPDLSEFPEPDYDQEMLPEKMENGHMLGRPEE